MTNALSPLCDAYIQATNAQDRAGFLALFDDDAVVDDNFREIRGLPAIRDWCEEAIFAVHVTLEVLGVEAVADRVVIRTKVDGDFDRTGLPDPVIISHSIDIRAAKIIGLTCRLVA